MIDLFGHEVSDEAPKRPAKLGIRQAWKVSNRYRRGTKNRCCKRCDHRMSHTYHNIRYHKCELLGCSRSESTDIRLRNVCDRFKGKVLI